MGASLYTPQVSSGASARVRFLQLPRAKYIGLMSWKAYVCANLRVDRITKPGFVSTLAN